MIPYGSPEWLQRLRAAGYEPVGRIRGLVVVRLPWGSIAKVVGGTPESPTLIEIISPSAEVMAVGAEQRAPAEEGSGTGMIERTWIEWYNNVAVGRDQGDFDRAAARIDELGVEAMPGGSEDDLVESYRWTHPNIYKPLINYRDTGGRKGLRAELDELRGDTKQYGDEPIQEAQAGGPMEESAGVLTLHPGRYTYSNAIYDSDRKHLFPHWLDEGIKDEKLQALRTQVSVGVLEGIPLLRQIDTPYHRDYEFLVLKDIQWNDAIPSTPTWLPKGSDVQSYWGKPISESKGIMPDLPSGDALMDMLQKLFILGVVLGGGYVVIQLAKTGRKPQPA